MLLIVFTCSGSILKCTFWFEHSPKNHVQASSLMASRGVLFSPFTVLLFFGMKLINPLLGTGELPAGPGPGWHNSGTQGAQFKEALILGFEQVQRQHVHGPESECLLKSCTCPAVTTSYFLLQTQEVASVDPTGRVSNSRSPKYSQVPPGHLHPRVAARQRWWDSTPEQSPWAIPRQ